VKCHGFGIAAPQVCASVTSHTHERKSKTSLAMSKGRIVLKLNTFA
jgi:hypothetical protein